MFFVYLLYSIISYMFIFFALNISSKKLYNRFNKHLLSMVKDELIYMRYYNNIKELNNTYKTMGSYSSSNSVLGLYSYIKDATVFENMKHQLPKIHIIKSDKIGDLMTFAHELGHHFEITKNKNFTERAADEYAVKLLLDVLNWKEIIIYYPLIIKYKLKFLL